MTPPIEIACSQLDNWLQTEYAKVLLGEKLFSGKDERYKEAWLNGYRTGLEDMLGFARNLIERTGSNHENSYILKGRIGDEMKRIENDWFNTALRLRMQNEDEAFEFFLGRSTAVANSRGIV